MQLFMQVCEQIDSFTFQPDSLYAVKEVYIFVYKMRFFKILFTGKND